MQMTNAAASRPPWLERLALHRPELRAWALYDWANSVFMATIVPVFPIYFAKTVCTDVSPAAASARIALATALAMGTVALLSPVLGAMADYSGARKRMLGACLGVGVLATGSLSLVGPGDWIFGLALYVVANIAVTASFVFYESLLPHLARPHELDRLSSTGYALGYLGGGLQLALNLACMARPGLFGLPDAGAATRLAFLSAAVWWGLFSLPLFLRVAEPAARLERGEVAGGAVVAAGLRRLLRTLGELRGYREAFSLLLAFLLYNDAVNTVIRMGTAYGTERGIAPGSLMAAILMVQFVAFPCAFLCGALAARVGPRPVVFGTLGVYVLVTVVAYQMTSAAHFFLLAFLVGTSQGGCQALSRSLFASMVPRHRSSEFFGFFGVFEKFAGVLGPSVFALMALFTGSSRNAVLSLVLFVVAGAVLLARVDVAAGQRVAREAEAAAGEA